MPGVHFCVADLLPSLSPLCAGDATCTSGTGQLLQGWWLSTPSLCALLSALGVSNPAEQVVVKQQLRPEPWAGSLCSLCRGTGQRWLLALFAAHQPRQGMWGWLLPTQPPHPHHVFTCPCSQPDVLLRAGKRGSVACRGLQGAGWTPQLLTTWRDGMAGAQGDCVLQLSEGTLEGQFTNLCYPMETPA